MHKKLKTLIKQNAPILKANGNWTKTNIQKAEIFSTYSLSKKKSVHRKKIFRIIKNNKKCRYFPKMLCILGFFTNYMESERGEQDFSNK